jgi:hypothetical protein
VITSPEAGRLVPREADAIVAAVREILSAPPAQTAVREAATRFSWGANASALYDHLTGIAR